MGGRAVKRMASVFLMAAIIFSVGACDDKDSSESFQDPAKKRAVERYEEGRRLFLTCDPNSYPQALSYFEEALDNNSDYPEALAAWAETLSMWQGFNMNQDAFENAMHRAQRATRLAPDLDMGYRAAADIYRHHRNPKTGKVETEYALDMIDRALEINPRSAENLYVKGSIYLTKDPLQAIKLLEEAKKLNPDLGKVYFNLASAHQMIADRINTRLQQAGDSGGNAKKELQKDMQSRYNQAEKNYKTYQSVVPGDLGGFCALGIVYLHQGELDKAEKMLKKTVTKNPNPDTSQFKWMMKAYYHLAAIEEKRGNLEEAYIYNQSAMDIAGSHPDFVGQRIRLCKKLDRTDCVKEYQKKLEELKQRQKELQKKTEIDKMEMEGGATVESAAGPEEQTRP
ncbi:MAG: tetratricopeptide repeat protein [bacterium]